MKETIIGMAVILGLLLAIAGASWAFCCGVVKLITLCFGWGFSWLQATGIWLILILLSTATKSGTTKQ